MDREQSVTSRRSALRFGAAAVGSAVLGATLPAHSAWSAPAPLLGSAAASGRLGSTGPAGGGLASARAAAESSSNGWTVGSPMQVIGVGNQTIPGTGLQIAVRAGDVATVLLHVAARFHAEVEPLRAGQVQGYGYRANVNSPGVWSNHASGTAIDLNFLSHPNGSRGTFSSAQQATLRRILDSLGGVVRWGGDYRGTPDEMHFEINVPPGDGRLATVAARLRGGPPAPPPAPAPVFVYGSSSGAASYMNGRRDIFGIAEDGYVQQATSFGGAFSGWKRPVGGGFSATPAVVLRNGRSDLFTIGRDGAAYRIRWQGGWEPGFHRLGGRFLGGLSVTYHDGRFDVWGIGVDGRIYQSTSGDGNNFSGWNSPVWGTYRATPAAIYHDGQYEVFAFGADDRLYRWTWNGGWRPPVSTPSGRFAGGPAATYHNGRYDVFAVDANGKLRQTIVQGGGFSGWYAPVAGTFSSTPAVTWAAGRYDLYVRGADAAMRHVWWQGNWSALRNLGGRFAA